MALDAEQMEQRRRRVGASEIAALVGMSPWSSAASVWAEKLGISTFEGNNYTAWGSTVESSIADWYAKENGLRSMASTWSFEEWLSSSLPTAALIPCKSLVHPAESWALATPDRLIVRDGVVEKILQIKNARGGDDWGEPGTDLVPDHYLCQVTWEMWICRATFGEQIKECDLCVCISGSPPVTYTVRYDEEFLQVLQKAGERFVREYLIPGVEPPLDFGHAGTQEYIAAKFAKDDGKTIRSETVETDELAHMIRDLAIKESKAKIESKALRAHMRNIIGSASRIEGPDWSATCRPVRGRIDWEAVAKEAGIPKELIEKHRAPAARVLKFKFGSGSSESDQTE